ncbi:hypothetical protein [Streptomyces sp. NPDC059063]|uniref:hypothetical protein n=1 Tax=unclassified Streptomyces TaxID=2593676 RepID=UPI0036891C45
MARSRNDAPRWDREEDKDWAATVEVRLVLDHDAPAGLAAEVLAEAHELVRAEGRTARELLGEPEAYARAVAEERVGEEHRARTDVHGLTPGERLTSSLATIGGVGILLGALQWVRDGLWVDASGSGVAAFATVVVAVVLVAVATVAGAAGRVKGAYGFAAATVGVVGGGAAVATLVPDGRLFSVPVPVLMAVCGGWIAGAVAFPDRVADRWFTPAPAGRDDEAWLRRLGGLLRGRHAMTGGEARGHVREARAHLAAAPGAGAADVFGDVEIYAHRLADGPRKQRRLARRKLYGSGLMLAVVGVLLVERVLDGGISWDLWLPLWTGAFGAMAWTAVSEWRESRVPSRASGEQG